MSLPPCGSVLIYSFIRYIHTFLKSPIILTHTNVLEGDDMMGKRLSVSPSNFRSVDALFAFVQVFHELCVLCFQPLTPGSHLVEDDWIYLRQDKARQVGMISFPAD